jgi:hypothetical protein
MHITLTEAHAVLDALDTLVVIAIGTVVWLCICEQTSRPTKGPLNLLAGITLAFVALDGSYQMQAPASAAEVASFAQTVQAHGHPELARNALSSYRVGATQALTHWQLKQASADYADHLEAHDIQGLMRSFDGNPMDRYVSAQPISYWVAATDRDGE